MGGDRRELGAGGQKGREMKDEIDLELREDAFQKPLVENRSDEFALDGRRPGEPGVQRIDVERDDRARPARGELADEAVTGC
jgi:hypothetical protein